MRVVCKIRRLLILFCILDVCLWHSFLFKSSDLHKLHIFFSALPTSQTCAICSFDILFSVVAVACSISVSELNFCSYGSCLSAGNAQTSQELVSVLLMFYQCVLTPLVHYVAVHRLEVRTTLLWRTQVIFLFPELNSARQFLGPMHSTYHPQFPSEVISSEEKCIVSQKETIWVSLFQMKVPCIISSVEVSLYAFWHLLLLWFGVIMSDYHKWWWVINYKFAQKEWHFAGRRPCTSVIDYCRNNVEPCCADLVHAQFHWYVVFNSL